MTVSRAGALLCSLATALVCASAAVAVPPSNDNFSTPFLLGTGSGATPSSNVEATKEEPDEPDHAGKPGGASVWFTWTAPVTGTLMVDTCDTEGVDSSFDTVLAVYSGTTLATLETIGGNDDACGPAGLQSVVEAPVEKDEEYRIAVDGVEEGDTGTFRLQYGLQPQNDEFAAAQALGGTGGSIAGNIFRASHELGEPNHAGDPGFGSVWFRWTAPSSGEAILDACASPDDTLLAVYTGATVASLTLVAENDDSPACASTGSRVEFEAVGGTTYSIAVDGAEWMVSFWLTWSLDPLPRNVSPPRLAGQAVEGGVMTVSPGTWARAGSYRYEWFQCRVGSCTLIPGQSGDQLQITAAAIGGQVRARVTAVNASGVASADSNFSPLVGYSPPVNLVGPSLRGVARVGALIEADPGRWWTGSSPLPSGPWLRWQRCDAGGQSCVDIRSSTMVRSIRVGANERGGTIRVLVWMTSRGGTTTVASAPSGVVPWTCGVPRVVGKTVPRARALSNRLSCKFRLIVSRRAWSNRGRGIIVKQTPRQYTQMGRGGRIRVVVSRGRRR